MTSSSESFTATVDIPIRILASSGTTSVSKTVCCSGGLFLTVELKQIPKRKLAGLAVFQYPNNRHRLPPSENDYDDVWVIVSFKHQNISDEKTFKVIGAGSISSKMLNGSGLVTTPFCISESSSESHSALLERYSYAETIVVAITYRKVFKSATTSSSSAGKHWIALLESGEGADAVFVVGGVGFPVHTYILGAISPVFKAMFTHETRDKLEKRVVIKDATAAAFKEMLRCAYADCDPEYKNDTFLLEVNALADRYDIAGLRSRCVRMLVETMTETALSNRVALVLKDNSSLSQAFVICMLKKMDLSGGTKELLKKHTDLSQYLQ